MRKLVKSSLLLAVSMIMCLQLAAFTASAESFPCVGIVVGDTVNVRTGPGTEYDIESQVWYGVTLDVFAREGNWFKIGTGNGNTAYISADYVSVRPEDVAARGNSSAGNRVVQMAKRYLGTLRNHFSTIGVNGINEMIRNFTGDTDDITTDWGHAFAVRFLDHVRERLVQFQAETDHMYNLEATPAEGTTYRFAKEDKKRFPNILQAGTPKNPYYTNSSQLPVGFTDDPFQALEMQEDLQKKYTGGTVLHLYMNEAISSAEACRDLVRRTLTRFRLPYITITPTFSICPKHGYIPGRHDFCPICDAELIAKKRAALAAKEKAAA